MKFDLRNGPWKTLFEGNFQGHEVEILTNPGQVMLVCIYEKEGKETTGVVLQAFSIFSVVGEAETFVESLQREAIILSRHDGKQTIQFLALGSRPAYAKGKDKEVVKAVDNLLKEIANLGGRLKGLAKNFDLHLTPLEKCSNAVKQAFFSQPTIVPMLVHFGVEAYEDGIDLSMEQFYRKLENSQNFPKTAAPGLSIFTEAVDVTPVIGAHTGPHILMVGVLEGEE